MVVKNKGRVGEGGSQGMETTSILEISCVFEAIQLCFSVKIYSWNRIHLFVFDVYFKIQ